MWLDEQGPTVYVCLVCMLWSVHVLLGMTCCTVKLDGEVPRIVHSPGIISTPFLSPNLMYSLKMTLIVSTPES